MRRIFPKDWLITAGILILATLLCRLLTLLGIGRESLLMVYMIGVQCCARSSHGYRYSVACALCSMMLFNNLYTEPVRTFSIREPNDVTLLLFFLMTAVLSAGMTVRLRDALDASRKSEQRAERFHNEKEKALLEAERAHMKSSLLRSIGHDLRTPLTGIQGAVEAMQDGVFPADAENLEALHAQVLLLNRLVDDLRTLANAEAGQLTLEKTPVELTELCRRQVSALQLRAAEQDINLTVAVSGEDDIWIEGDSQRLNQVLLNLLDNALRHTAVGGAVTVAVHAVDDAATVTVADNGPGIPPADLPHVFDRFYRTDPSRSRETGGSGLGLAISHNIILAHHGHIHAEPSPLGGLRVVVTLPESA